jgi:hypothetical protein
MMVVADGHELTVRFERVDQPELVFWEDPRIDVHRPDALLQGMIAHLGHVGPGEHVVEGREPDLPGDALGRGRVVACEHRHTYPGRLTLSERRGHGGPHRIGEADQPEEREREVMLLARQCRLLEGSAHHAQHSQSLPSQHPYLASQGLLL